MKYRKIATIDAFQYGVDEEPNWFIMMVRNGRIKISDKGCQIVSLEGTEPCPKGYFIAKGVEGEPYPIEPTIFKKTYEPVGE
jgi:hypothetical protein